MNKLFNHIKAHKGWYGFSAVAVFLVIGMFAYYRVPSFDDLTGDLTGQLRRAKPKLPSIQIVTPRPGDTFTAGDTITIQWKAATTPTTSRLSHSIYLLPQKGRDTTIARRVSGYSYNWRVPDNLSGSFKIGISGSLGKGVMSGFLTIAQPTVSFTNGQFAIKVYNHMINTQCAENLCAQMSNHRPEEVARCNLQARGVYGPPMPGYDWYEKPVVQTEAFKMLSVFPDDDTIPSQMPSEITEAWLDGKLAEISPKACPLSNGEFVARVYKHLSSASCEDNLCPLMSEDRPEEVARCNLQARGVYGPPLPGYDWYATLADREDATRVLARTFNTGISVPTGGVTADWLNSVLATIDVETPCQCPVVTRAEFTKDLIIKIDGLAGYEAPATPTFDDVPADAWYFDYVEAAVQLGIVTGYSDAQGNLTGMFGPGDQLNRAEFIKVVITAIDGLADYQAPPTATFDDVSSGDWYYNYVEAAVQLDLIVTNATQSSFYPSHTLDKCFMGEVIVRIDYTQPTPTQGVLTAVSEDNPDGRIVSGGSTDVLVARYRFHALDEDFAVNKLTIMNDVAGAFDTAIDRTSIEQITIKYTDEAGVERILSSPLVAGSATFAGLDFYVPAGEDAFLRVYADTRVITAGISSLSGQTFRLGMQNANNTVSTFEAVGQSSATADYFIDGDEVTGAGSVNTFVVRKAKPVFASLHSPGSPAQMGITNNDLYQLTVSANGGDVSLARLVFDVATYGLSGGAVNEDIYNFKFRSGQSLGMVSDVVGVNIRADGINLKNSMSGSGLAAVEAGAGVVNATYKVIVSFDNEEVVERGQSKTYVLRADISGATTDHTIVRTTIASGDENVGLIGLTDTANANTGKIYAANNAASGIFTVNATDLSRSSSLNRNIIWSDQAGTPDVVHYYPTVSDGAVTDGTGTADWTNGYLLKINELTGHELRQ